LLEVRSPPRLAETVRNLEALKQLTAFPAVREQLDSTNARRGRQLLAYAEKELGGKWPDLLDRLAGGGAALAVQFAPVPAPALVVVQGRDEKLAAKFFKLLLTVVEGELARQESPERVVKHHYHGVETVQVGKEAFLARAGAALLFSNKDFALKAALDLHLGRTKNSLADVPAVAEAARLLPKDLLANLWINLKAAHETRQGKSLYKTLRGDPNVSFLVGAILDVVGRSPYLAAGLFAEKDGFRLSVRMPRGRDGMGADRLLHLPPDGQHGSRPLLAPKGAVFSHSYHLDLAAFWNDREKLFPKKVAKAITDFNKTSGRFLLGNKLSTLLTQTGPYHRFVVVDQSGVDYKRKPKQAIPAFAHVVELRQPEKFARSMSSLLRTAAFLGSFQVRLKLAEETHKGVKIVGYRFPEDAELKNDVSDLRFNFSPCFARVGNQFVFCSTVGLCRELVELLQLEQKAPAAGDAATSRIRLYAAGAGDLISTNEDILITQTILDQAAAPGEAREQVKALIAYVRKLGTLDLTATYLDREFRYDFRARK
jgi:hypothetical protein